MDRKLINAFLDSVEDSEVFPVEESVGSSLNALTEILWNTVKFDMDTMAYMMGHEGNEWRSYFITVEDFNEWTK